MNSFYYPLYQLVGWLSLAGLLLFSIAQQPGFSQSEYLFVAVLVGSTALFSHLMRWLYKAAVGRRTLLVQALYFIVAALSGGLLAGGALLAAVWGLAQTPWLDPIPAGQFSVIVDFVYWPNATNMIIALLLWSAIYLSVVRSRQLRDAEQALSRSQLEMLMQQLSPHFLFNVLNNIRALILENPNRARDALAQLADMLRYSLYADQTNKVKLCEELAVVEEYIGLCKIQFEQRLSFNTEIASDATTAMIPRLLLQQSIENAVKHGISQQRAGGQITVRAVRDGDQLVLRISNPAPLQSVHLNENQNSGLGLKNSRARLQLMYGKQAHLKLQRQLLDESTQQVTLTIHLPFEAHTGETKPCA